MEKIWDLMKKYIFMGFCENGFCMGTNIMYPYQTHNFYTILGPVA